MAWNEPGNKGNDPWGNKGGNDKGPPDLDEVFRNLSKRFGGKGNGSGQSFSSFSLIIILAVAVVVWGLSGFIQLKKLSVVWHCDLVNTLAKLALDFIGKPHLSTKFIPSTFNRFALFLRLVAC